MRRSTVVAVLLLAAAALGAAPAARAAQEPVPIASWAGSGSTTTETFEVASAQWRVRWEGTNPNHGMVAVYVNHENGRMLGRGTSEEGDGRPISGQTVMRGAGRYYLEVISAGVTGWTITVEEVP